MNKAQVVRFVSYFKGAIRKKLNQIDINRLKELLNF